MTSSRWIQVTESGTFYPTNHRGGASETADDSAFARTFGRGAVLHALLVTGQHATEEATVTIEGVALKIPSLADRVLYGRDAWIQLGGPQGWALPGGFSVATTHDDATFVVWYELL